MTLNVKLQVQFLTLLDVYKKNDKSIFIFKPCMHYDYHVIELKV